jgi:hypothetical protein
LGGVRSEVSRLGGDGGLGGGWDVADKVESAEVAGLLLDGVGGDSGGGGAAEVKTEEVVVRDGLGRLGVAVLSVYGLVEAVETRVSSETAVIGRGLGLGWGSEIKSQEI